MPAAGDFDGRGLEVEEQDETAEAVVDESRGKIADDEISVKEMFAILLQGQKSQGESIDHLARDVKVQGGKVEHLARAVKAQGEMVTGLVREQEPQGESVDCIARKARRSTIKARSWTSLVMIRGASASPRTHPTS
jgi:hypothetical protein